MEGKDNQNEVLLSISNEIARIRGKDDMLHLIGHTLKEYLRFDDSQILKYNKTNRTCKPYIYHAEQERAGSPQFRSYLDLEYAVVDDSIEEFLSPVVYDIASLIPAGSEQIRFMHGSGLKEFVVIKLIEASELIGLLVLLTEQKNSFKKEDLDLLQKIAFQIAIATAKIIADEEILRRETEKTILLSFANEISVLKNRNDLFRIVNERIRRIFTIHKLEIAIIDDDRKTYSTFLFDLSDDFINEREFKEENSIHYNVTDALFSRVMNSEDPVEIDVNEIIRMPNAPAFVKLWKKVGLKSVLCAPLRAGGQNLGMAVLHIDTDHAIDPNSSLVKGICAQLSVAIFNILASEEIDKREKEKSFLLSLSGEIASLKERNDLHRIVNTRIKKLFGIKQFGIAQINEDRITHSAFMMDLGDEVHSHVDFSEVTSQKYDITDTAFSRILASDDPVTLNVLQLADEPDPPAYVGFWVEVGFRELLCLSLRVGGNNVGCIFFNINADEIYNLNTTLLKGVCAQLAVAVSNILANEKIRMADEEKALLLSFSNDIATVRDKEGLRLIVKQYLKNIFHIREYIITTRNGNGETYSYFLHDSVAGDPDDEGWKTMLGNQIPVKGAFIGAVLQSEHAVFDIEEILQNKAIYFPAAAFWKAAGARKVMGFRLKVAEKDIGLLVIQPGQINNQLLRGISAQLAIAIANIIAIEEIVGREKEKSMLLEFSNAIASVRDNSSLSKIINRELKGLFGINEYAIHVLSEDKRTHRPIFYDPEADFARHPVFLSLVNQPIDVNDGIFNTILASDDPITFDAEQWATLKEPPVYAGAAKDIGLKKLTGVRIHLADENIAVLNFRHDDTAVSPGHYPLLKSICSQIAIAISNIISNEKVLNQLAEINRYKQQLEEEKVYLKEEIETSHNFSELIGGSDEMKKVFALVSKVAPTDSTVLILGETGTGKELIARAIHNASSRKSKLMVKVNCAAIPPNLIESELFGHERGSFTGATERRIGKFELAHNGTLFLDEIGEMPLELQVKLLRALQEREIERLGGRAVIKVDVRIIAATNRDLEKFMDEGKFRSDLYYRLNIFPILLPSLRDRKEDIPSLALHFVKRFSKKAGKKINSISDKAMQELAQYYWPGNIRELEHLIERSVLLATGDTITTIHLPSPRKNTPVSIRPEDSRIKTIEENEREHILKVLNQVNGRISGEGGAAELLGVPPSTLSSKLKRLGIRKDHFG